MALDDRSAGSTPETPPLRVEKMDPEMVAILRAKSGAEIDRAYIREWAGRLGLVEIWDRVLESLES